MKDTDKKEVKIKEVATSKKLVVTLDKRTFRYIIFIVAFAIVLFWGFNRTDQPISLIKTIISVSSPIITGLCIAFVINVVMRQLENLWSWIWRKSKRKWHEKIKRPLSLVLSTCIFIGALFAVVFMIMPEIVKTTESFAKNVPQYITQIEALWDDVIEFAEKFDIVLPEITVDTDRILNTISSILKNNDSMIFDKTIDITTSIFNGVFNFVLAFVFSIYVLGQKEKLGSQCKNLMFAYFKKEKVDRFLEIIALTNQTFANFVSGQFTEAFIIGALCFIGMSIFAMPYAPVISVLVGFTALIPIFGAFIGTAAGAFLILLVDPMKAVWFVVFIIVLQQIEGNLIYPRVVGKSVGLPGIWVIAAVTVGNSLLGVVGMLISVPCCAVIYCIIRESIRERLKKKTSEEKEKQEAIDTDVEPDKA